MGQATNIQEYKHYAFFTFYSGKQSLFPYKVSVFFIFRFFAIVDHEHFCLQVKCMLVLHLISAAFATAALGLMSKHLPYRQDSYHCEHCRRLELHAVVLSSSPTQANSKIKKTYQ